LFATAVTPSLTSGASSDSFPVEVLSAATGHHRLATEAHSPVEPIPFRVPHHLPAVRPVGRTSFPEISGPYNDVTLGSPMWSRLSRPPRLRSQAFSTSQRFPSIPVLRGLVSCRSRSWDLPSEVSPRENRAPLSRPLAPLQSSTSAQRRAFRVLIAACFTDSHARAQLPGSPDDYGLPFHAPKRASRSPWNPSDRTAPSR